METLHKSIVSRLLENFPYRDLLLNRISKLYAIYQDSYQCFVVEGCETHPLVAHHYHITDVHGSLRLLLNVLLHSGIIRFRPDAQPIIYYCFSKQSYVHNLRDIFYTRSMSKLQALKTIKEIVVLPNVELNPDFIGYFTMGGDLIDRGSYSEECFYLMRMLLEQQATGQVWSEQRLWYLLGNHEMATIGGFVPHLDILESNYYTSMLTMNNMDAEIAPNGKAMYYKLIGYNLDTMLTRTLERIHKYRFRNLRQDLLALIQQRRLDISYLGDDGATYAHSFWSVHDVERLLACCQKYPEFSHIIDELVVINKAGNQGIALKPEQIKLLNQTINQVWYYAAQDAEALAIVEHHNDYDNSCAGLVWNRAKKFPNGDAIMPRLRMPFIIGHTIMTSELSGIVKDAHGNIGKGCVWYTDTDSIINDQNGKVKYIEYQSQRHQYILNILEFAENSQKLRQASSQVVHDFSNRKY